MTDLEKAKSLLKNNITCVLVKDDNVLSSTKTGIAPVMELIENNVNLEGYSVADKIVGKAVAMLFCKEKIKDVYGEVLSESAKVYLEKHGINFSYNILAKAIINRQKAGICPMEETVKDIENCDEAFIALKNKLASLKNIQERKI